MRIFCSEFSKFNDKMNAKSVLMQKKGNSYTLLKYYNTDAENIQHLSKNAPLIIGMDYYIVDETVYLPPINDDNTFKVLALNKLKESLEPGVNYLVAYKKYAHIPPDQNGNHTYKVFLAPESLFYHDSCLTDDQKQLVQMFTISDFALSSLAKKFYPGMIVFHAYSDGRKIFVTVCHDDVIVYTRSNIVNHDAADKFSTYYEYLNLTFMYATKNLRLNIEQVIFSGELSQMTDLAMTFFEFSKIPQSTLVPGSLITNCPYDIFQEYMIPISLCFLDESYDITPRPVVIEQAKNDIKFAAGVISVLLVLGLLFLNLTSAFNLYSAYQDLNITTVDLSRNIREYTSLASSSDNKKYELFYYNRLKEKNNNVDRLFADFADLLKIADFESVTFEKEDTGKTSVIIAGDFELNSLNALEKLKSGLQQQADKLTADQKYIFTDSSVYSMDKLSVDVSMRFEKNMPGGTQ